ncbi:hypothetical protein [Mangrovicella endophytica]|nr:hypothetical protein [Mangrovicella endophytica]
MRILTAIVLLATLAGCAEINKPIKPNDTWGSDAEAANAQIFN